MRKTIFPVTALLCLTTIGWIQPSMAGTPLPNHISDEQALEMAKGVLYNFIHGEGNNGEPHFIQGTANRIYASEPFIRGNLPDHAVVEIAQGTVGEVKGTTPYSLAIVSHDVVPSLDGQYRGKLELHRKSFHHNYETWSMRIEATISAPYFANSLLWKEYRIKVLYEVDKPEAPTMVE